MAEAHEWGLHFFAEGQYQAALECFEECLRQAETSEVWNDWATTQFAAGRLEVAKRGLKRALELDPHNAQAAANLSALETLAVTPPKSSPGGADTECAASPQGAAKPPLRQGGDDRQMVIELSPAILELVRDIRAIPGEDPSLAPHVIATMRVTSIDSGYFVEKCLERLGRVPADVFSEAREILEKLAEMDYRLSLVLAGQSMQVEDYETAISHLRTACDSVACDLFAENMLIACTRRLAAKAGTACEFDGLEEYLAGSFCDKPWTRMEIYQGGFAALCCFGWLPLAAGRLTVQSMEEIWNSELAVALRRSILDGSFRFCSKIHCQFIAGRSLPRRSGPIPPASPCGATEATKPWVEVNSLDYPERLAHGPQTVRVCYDRTCNLACPQCRNSFYVATREEQASFDRTYLPIMLRAAQDAQMVGMNGSGDPFVSNHCRHLLSLLKRNQFPRLKFWFTTNGQLVNERTFREFDLYGRVGWIQVSIDAARPETYAIVRRGGDFRRLLANLALLDGLRISRGEKFKLELWFVVSSMNFREMPEFVQMGRKFHADSIVFNRIRNWGHLSLDKFEKLNVADPSHPEHQDFLGVMQSPELSDPIVDCGSVTPFRRSRWGGDEKGFGRPVGEAKPG